MDVDLRHITVYELREVHLRTCAGVLAALTDVERVGVPRLSALLAAHAPEPFAQRPGPAADAPPAPLGRTSPEPPPPAPSLPDPPALDLAAEAAEHYPQVLPLLLAAGADPRRGCPVPALVRHSTKCGAAALALLRTLAAAGADPGAWDACAMQALHWAASDAALAAYVPALLEAGAPVDAAGGADRKTPLMLAAVGKCGETCGQLLDAGVRGRGGEGGQGSGRAV